MAKNRGNQQADEQENVNENLGVGNVDEAALASMHFDEVDPLKGLDAAYSAGQPGFEKGVTKLGIYKGTKLCVSTKEKKPRWKALDGKPGKVCKKLHIFQCATTGGEVLKTFFGLWHTGTLTAALQRIKRESLIAVTYLGQSDKPFREGDTPPHMFKIRGKGIEVKMTDLADIEPDMDDDTPLTPEQAASLQRTRDAINNRNAAPAQA
jgi:hypothetical protein